MRRELFFIVLITLMGCLFGLATTTFLNSSTENTYDLSVIFLGFGLTSLLIGILFISGKFFFDCLKVISLRAWRICLYAYFIFVLLILPKFGNSLIVAEEGWLSLYKHPFVWLILLILIGNVVVHFYKPKSMPKLS